ncbi:NAD(P)/FAD-dependent oxidoreductase [Natronorubrum thiooxidans]|uniref:NADH:ubiquinone reductase (non-electrogenic) n=1 Tax=Natronorubrum thiooxidans TaxID=308853 RepID=A0A1N7GMC6_9EURY|nr:NAD(P)/FAD-dependent oxidoreductase [Natronorubrum thiooxidans]SIS13744.1 NADH dehydrogenase [Natronorubrum thiooxidans]
MTVVSLVTLGSGVRRTLSAGRDPVLERTLLAGFVAGIVPGIILSTIIEPWILGVALGPVFGLLYGLGFGPSTGSYLDHAVSAAAMSVPAWLLVHVIGLPLVHSRQPEWGLEGSTALAPTLVGWTVAGTLVGLLLVAASSVLEVRYGRVSRKPRQPAIETRIVILGGGFAGLTVAKRLEKRFGPDPTVQFTLVSETNAILFTPLLAEVAAGGLEPTHVTTPLRTSLKRTEVLMGTAVDVDLEEGYVVLDTDDDCPVDGRSTDIPANETRSIGDSASRDLVPYDHLVVALGSVADYKGLEGVREFAFDFKTLADAMAIRNHVIGCFERAERTADPATRERLLTFVIAGAGFAGAEFAGALNDFVRGTLIHYPTISSADVEVVVVHSRDRIMPELSDTLAAYALERMRDRGVRFELETYLETADRRTGVVSLSTGKSIGTETLVWTAGNRPNPFVELLGVPAERPGAITVDASLSVPGYDGVWAAGDCAAVPDPETGTRSPPTAEHATRAGTVLADNIYASVTGGSVSELDYRSPGSLAVVGYQTACAELWGRQFSGLLAWVLWRLVYLSKLPGTDRKIRVLVSWLIELVFPREFVQTMGERRRPPEEQ